MPSCHLISAELVTVDLVRKAVSEGDAVDAAHAKRMAAREHEIVNRLAGPLERLGYVARGHPPAVELDWVRRRQIQLTENRENL